MSGLGAFELDLTLESGQPPEAQQVRGHVGFLAEEANVKTEELLDEG